MPIKVAIVEDDVRVLESLARLLNSTEGVLCHGQYASAEGALSGIPKDLPDVVLMDIQLPRLNGIECVRQLLKKNPALLVVMLTVFENTNVIFSAISAGACGYLLKRASPDEIIAAIRDVRSGGSPMTSNIARRVLGLFQRATAEHPGYGSLSLREHQVVEFLAQGFSYKEIAGELEISYATVHSHIRHIYKKLQVNSRTDAAALHLGHVVHGYTRLQSASRISMDLTGSLNEQVARTN